MGWLKTLISWIFLVISFPFRMLWKLVYAVISLIFGRLSWEAPVWLKFLGNLSQKGPKRFWGGVLVALLVLGGAGYGYHYYQNLPKPVTVSFESTPPGVTPYGEILKPEPLVLSFFYQPGSSSDDAPPQGLPSVVPLKSVSQAITKGIMIEPEHPGTWEWRSDSVVVFTPSADWPANQTYVVSVDSEILSDEYLYESLDQSFTTPELDVNSKNVSFYQDPVDKNKRQVVATYEFSHPIDRQSFERFFEFGLQNSTTDKEDSQQEVKFLPLKYEAKFDKHQRIVDVTSVNIQVPDQSTYAHLNLDKGVRAHQGEAKTDAVIRNKVLIPDRYSYLKVNAAKTHIVKNEKEEPVQVVTLEFTDEIALNEIQKNVALYLLPKHPKKRQWKESVVNQKVINQSIKVTYKITPNPRTKSKIYNLTIDEPQGRELLILIEKNLPSANDYLLAAQFKDVKSIPYYPIEASILGDGSVYSVEGQRTMGFLSRGLEALKVRLGKVPASQLNHLISQTYGNISSPQFQNYYFNHDNIVQRKEVVLPLAKMAPQKANYSSLDLTPYLMDEEKTENGNRALSSGIFFVEVLGWDLKRNRSVTDVKDHRLIMVTDIGILVKKHSDGQQDIFIQSLSSGEPLEQAKVELLGKNGVALFSGMTAEEGHVHFAPADKFQNEKTPTVYRVSRGEDVSFLPYDNYGTFHRYVNFSRFDVGGDSRYGEKEKRLKAFVFSDRGIYRPGESVELGMLIKQEDFTIPKGTIINVVIEDPRGKVVHDERLKVTSPGLLESRFTTKVTSSTGYYNAQVYLIDRKGYQSQHLGGEQFKVEEFQPDTIKVSAQLNIDDNDVSQNQGWLTVEKLQADVTVENLFGNPAQNRKVTGKLTVSPTEFSFHKFKDFTFIDPLKLENKTPKTYKEDLKNQMTNEDGLAVFDIDLNNFDQGTYQVALKFEGFEPDGGRSVSAYTSTLISPLNHLVGFKADGGLGFLKRNQNRKVNLLAVNSNLQKEPLDSLKVVVLKKTPVSTLVKQRNGTFRYETVLKEEPFDQSTFNILEEGSELELNTTEAGEFVLSLVNKSGDVLTQFSYHVVGEGNLLHQNERNAELKVLLDKNDYQSGEEIELNITAPYTGAGLITIESSSLHTYKWFKTDVTNTLQSITVPDGIEGNAYVNVTFLRALDSKEIYTSPLSYSVVPFNVDRSSREIKVELDVDKVVRPGKEMEIRFETDKASSMVIYAIDEGILQVADYKTPNPLDYFLTKRALRVSTTQMLDLLLPEYRFYEALSGIGGGMRAEMLAANLNPFARKTDKPAVFWSGVIETDGNVQESVKFQVPDTFSGQLRVMAVATNESAVGVDKTTALVKGPFVLTPQVLNVAAPGDEFEVSLGVANLIEGSGEQAEITIEAVTSENLEFILEQNNSDAHKKADKVDNEKISRTLKISELSEGIVSFKVRALEQLGEANITFHAHYSAPSGSSLNSEHSKRSASLSLRPSQPYRTTLVSGYTASRKHTVDLDRSVYKAYSNRLVSASHGPLVLSQGLTSYLADYVHGCTEQIVSQVLPWLSLGSHPAYQDQQAESREKFLGLLQQLKARQTSSGGFALWPGLEDTARYPSVYASLLLIEALDKGFPVSEQFIDSVKPFLWEVARNQNTDFSSLRLRAKSIYLLTRLGELANNELIDLRQVLDSNKSLKLWKQDIMAIYMAASYHLLQNKEAANKLVKGFVWLKGNHEWLSPYESPLSLNAQYVFILAKHFPKQLKQQSGDTGIHLAELLEAGQYNTNTAALVTLALTEMSLLLGAGHETDSIKFVGQLLVNKEGDSKSDEEGVNTTVDLDDGESRFPSATWNKPLSSVSIQSDQPLFYILNQSGFDRSAPTTVVKNGFEIYREYLNQEGEIVKEVKHGDVVNVRVRVRSVSGNTQTQTALIELLPGGFEVKRSSVEAPHGRWHSEYIDVREDRIIFYGDIPTKVVEFTYQAKATAKGTFVTPASYVESMYRSNQWATGEAGILTVLDKLSDSP